MFLYLATSSEVRTRDKGQGHDTGDTGHSKFIKVGHSDMTQEHTHTHTLVSFQKDLRLNSSHSIPTSDIQIQDPLP